MFGENAAKMQRGTVDRISELPEFILHTILSMLDTREACRASVLSKRWYGAWCSVPVLDFRPRYFVKYGNCPYKYDDNTVECFVEFVNKTMRRYFTRKYRITKMYLELPKVDEKLEPLVDKWIMIAVQNQIQELGIDIVNGIDYKLPEILFSAKSLKVLICGNVGLSYYETMDLISLEYLAVAFGDNVDEDMLQRMISSCPLVVFDIKYETCIKNISIPWVKTRGNGTMQSNLQELSLRKLVYFDVGDQSPWPWNMNVVALKNLRELVFDCVSITDDIVSELSNGLVALESLVLSQCIMLERVNISSNSLKQLQITNCMWLKKARIDTPNLLELSCCCGVVTSLSLIRVFDHCNAKFFILDLYSVTTALLSKLKKILVQTNFKSLVIEFDTTPEIEFEEEQLKNVGTAAAPYKLRELKLRGTNTRTLPKSTFVTFLNGLFWCCRPDVLSVTTNLEDSPAKLILSILKEKAQYWKDPLKSFEVESIEYPRLLSDSSELEIRLRLSWQSY
ncbi:FBD-associated F-box protein At4g10400-like [Silene latifolia]|uniref:FBD-associated F-box protein At4g10400-like n=1 Tax=Silene latifolia TaxID=37657 RepID=UPI003D784A4F